MTRQLVTLTSTLVASLLSASIVQAQAPATPAAQNTDHKSAKPKAKAKKLAKASKKSAAKTRVAVNFATPPAAPPTAAQQRQALAKASPGHAAVSPMSQMQQQQPAPYVAPLNEKWVANPPQPHPLPKTAPKRPAIVVQPYASPKTSPNVYAQNTQQNTQQNKDSFEPAPDLDAQEGMLRAATHYRQPVPHRDFTLIPFAAGGYSTFQLNGDNNSATANQSNTGTMDYAGGVLAEFEWGHLGMQTGLVYMNESTKFQASQIYSDGSKSTATGTESVHYIGVPLLAKMTSGRHGQVRFSAKAGVIPVFESQGTIDASTSTTYQDGTVLTGASSSSSSDTLRSMNALAQAGAGIEIPLTNTVDLRIEGLFNRSLLSIENDSSPTKTYSQSFQGLVGFGVGI